MQLGGGPGVVRALLTASDETRIARLRDEIGLDANAAAKAMRDSDKARRDHFRRFYDVSDELPVHYDVIVNTDHVSGESHGPEPQLPRRDEVDRCGVPRLPDRPALAHGERSELARTIHVPSSRGHGVCRRFAARGVERPEGVAELRRGTRSEQVAKMRCNPCPQQRVHE